MVQVRILFMILCYGFHHVSLKNIFVSHRGQDEDNCGNWTLPCRSVRHAVKISIDNDVIYIDYAEGEPYKECEPDSKKVNRMITLDKSLSFYGINGTAILYCEQEETSPFFWINVTSKIVFSNLSLATRRSWLFNFGSSMFELEFNFCNIERCLGFVMANNLLSCSLQVFGSNIRSSYYPIIARCSHLTVRLIESTFFSCSVTLSSPMDKFNLDYQGRKPVLNVYIYNCNFVPTNRQESCDHVLGIFPGSTNVVCYITIKSSTFMNFYNFANATAVYTLSIFSQSRQTTIFLDWLRFENIPCCDAVIYMNLFYENEREISIASILNTVFVNTTRAVVCVSEGPPVKYLSRDIAKFYNNTFNITYGVFGKEGPIYLVGGGAYHFSSCRFFQNAPVHNPMFPFIHFGGVTRVKFENCSYESYRIPETSRIGNLSNSDMFYVLSYDTTDALFTMEGYLTILCPQGYTVNVDTNCYKYLDRVINCNLFSAFCEKCPRKTYSLDRGEAQKTWSNHITCHDCPAGGDCVDGQVTSKPNFWGYKSNQTVTFLQCPPKYCCGADHCKTYHSCYGNRMGTLCGKCPIGMSESLFDTKCKANKDCRSVSFWPAISAYLILYLLFFLYQKDIINFVLRHITPRYTWCFRNGQNFNSGGLLKILFYYYQVVHLLSTSVGSDVKVQFVDDIENFLSRAFSFLIIAIPSIDCPFQDLRPVQKAIIVHSVGYSLLALLCLLYLSIFVFKMAKKLRAMSTQQTVAAVETMDHSSNSEDNPFLGRIAGAFTNISLLMYASSAHLCLSLLHCVPVGDNHVLFLDGNVKCYQTFQYFLLAYLIFSIFPFCLVPVLGSYLLKLNRISVTQFCLSCIIPLPFCCYWSYLLVRNSSWWTSYRIQDDAMDENSTDSTTTEQRAIVSGNSNSETENSNTESELKGCKHAVLSVLLGPFRQHKAIFIFPASHLPWEGFLILRRLVLILVVTFVYDTRVKATLSMIVCAVILLPHVFVKPFKSASDNVVETLSLVMLIVISGFGLIKSIYYGEDLDSGSKSLLNMINVIENSFKIFPIALVLFLGMFCILLKLTIVFRRCIQAIFRRLRFFKQANQISSGNCTPEEQQSLLSS